MGWCSMEVSSAFWMVDGRGRLSIVDGGLGGEGCVGRVVCKQAEASFCVDYVVHHRVFVNTLVMDMDDLDICW